MTTTIKKIGTLSNDESIQQIRLKNASLDVTILNFGATIQSIYLTDHAHSLVLGANSTAAYEKEAKYFGAVVGRVANRINKGYAMIDGKEYHLPLTPPEIHQLHGGPAGTGSKIWQIIAADEEEVHLQTMLNDGEMGYPGNMIVDVYYRLIGSALEMEIQAVADQTTLCNFAGHSYFNLDGIGSILDHNLSMKADAYLPVDDTLIPTGEIKSVDNSPFDFRTLRPIGSSMGNAEFPGFDTNFCLANKRRDLCEVAKLVAPLSGLSLTYLTTEPGLQVYDGRHINLPSSDNINAGGLHAYSGVALEAQLWPDAINHPEFPSIVLLANEKYSQTTRYAFS